MRAEGQRLEDVGAATKAAIDEHRHAAADGVDDRRQLEHERPRLGVASRRSSRR